MNQSASTAIAPDGLSPQRSAERTAMAILIAITFSHLLNDLVQSLVVAVYPMLKDSFHLSFAQIGLITLTYQITASLLQPVVGLYTDRHPQPYSLCVGMGFTMAGLILLAAATSLGMLMFAAGLVGMGSSVFHPEASRIARTASGGRHGLAQSLFQVGGNLGSALGPLGAAIIVLPRGQGAIGWFSCATLLAMVVLFVIGSWYQRHLLASASRTAVPAAALPLPTKQVAFALAILGMLVFSKCIYLASLTNFYTFYLIERFELSVHSAQLHLFVFLLAVAAGTILGGPLGDRIGRKPVIWISILGVTPFTLALPYANLLWTEILTVPIGLILASAFSAILVYAQELLPGRVGLISGLFFGLAFGVAGIGAAALGSLADHTSLSYVYQVCSFLPLLGILTAWLPERGRR